MCEIDRRDVFAAAALTSLLTERINRERSEPATWPAKTVEDAWRWADEMIRLDPRGKQ